MLSSGLMRAITSPRVLSPSLRGTGIIKTRPVELSRIAAGSVADASCADAEVLRMNDIEPAVITTSKTTMMVRPHPSKV